MGEEAPPAAPAPKCPLGFGPRDAHRRRSGSGGQGMTGSARAEPAPGPQCPPRAHAACRAIAVCASPRAAEETARAVPPELPQPPPPPPQLPAFPSQLRNSLLANPLLHAQIASPAYGPAPARPPGKPGASDPAGAAGGTLGMLAGAGRAGLRAASRKPQPRGGCGRERDGPRRWAHALRGLLPRASRLGAQLAATSAARHHHVPALPGCSSEKLQPSPRTGCRHCPPGPPPRLPPLPPPRVAAGPRTRAPGTRSRRLASRPAPVR